MLKYFEILCALTWLVWPYFAVPILWPVDPIAAFAITIGCALCAMRGVISAVDARS